MSGLDSTRVFDCPTWGCKGLTWGLASSMRHKIPQLIPIGSTATFNSDIRRPTFFHSDPWNSKLSSPAPGYTTVITLMCTVKDGRQAALFLDGLNIKTNFPPISSLADLPALWPMAGQVSDSMAILISDQPFLFSPQLSKISSSYQRQTPWRATIIKLNSKVQRYWR